MNIERLKELKSWVSVFRKYGVSDGNEIIVLIDEAIARQSVKREDVAEAIEEMAQASDRAHYSQDGNHVKLPVSLKTIDLAIAALRQYRKPTDEAVRLCSTCIGCECEPELGETVKNCKCYIKREPNDVADAIEARTDNPLYNADIRKTILQALRQMGSTEPCEWCDKDAPETWNYTRSGKYIPEYQTPRNYCRACGRPLKGGE